MLQNLQHQGSNIQLCNIHTPLEICVLFFFVSFPFFVHVGCRSHRTDPEVRVDDLIITPLACAG